MERDDDKSIRMVDIIKFEIRNVRGNILMTAAEKNSKIKQLKLLIPGCKDWEGLDEPVAERRIR